MYAPDIGGKFFLLTSPRCQICYFLKLFACSRVGNFFLITAEMCAKKEFCKVVRLKLEKYVFEVRKKLKSNA